MYIAIYFIWQFVTNVYYGKFIVCNPSINLVNTLIRAGINRFRSLDGITISISFTYVLCYEDILVKEGKSSYFVPEIKAGIKRVGVEEELHKMIKWVEITEIANVADKPRSGIEILDSLKPKKRLEMEKLNNKL